MRTKLGWGISASLALVPACLDRPVAAPAARLTSAVVLPVENNTVDQVDILFEIDNSNSMRDNQVNLARNFNVLISQLVNPPINPMTMRRDYPPVKSMHVGVISSDLGTPGSMVPSCANSDVGDDGILNPIRNGPAIRSHQPWTSAAPGVRPMRCENRPDQYPNFLEFNADTSDAARAAGLADAGRIAVGARADLALFPGDDPRIVAYALGGLRAALVVLGGQVVVENSSADARLW